MSATHSTLKTCLATAALCALHLGTTAANATPFVPMPESNAAELEFGSLLSDELAFSGDAAASAPTPPWSIARVCDQDQSPFMASINRVAARSSNPVQARRSLLLAMQMSTMCYRPDLTPEELDALIAATGLRPVALPRFQNRFDLDDAIWVGDGGQGARGKSTRARLTYSFPADGVLWGIDSRWFSFPNGLNNFLATNFGAVDTGKEWIRQGLAAYKHVAGLDLDEVGDGGIPMDTVTTRRLTVGDIRIGGNTLVQTNGGTNLAGVLAYNAFPASGSDMLIDLGETSFYTNSELIYRRLRNTVAHEHGHGLGFRHQVPCNNTKLMEPVVSTAYDVLQIDDRRGAGSGYGDRFSGNVTRQLAANLGTFSLPVLPARLIQNLSIARQNNGPTSGPNETEPSAFDWYSFTITSPQSMTIGMFPTGGTYSTGLQQDDPNDPNNACFGSSGSINATSAIDLDIELRDTDGTTVLANSTNNAGVSELITRILNPGTYFIRVYSFVADPGSAVQLYNLQVGITAGLWVPEANAGLNKRIGVGETCQFMGDVNTVPGQLPINSYQWDLDGNGTLDVVAARPTTVYFTPGIRRVRLAVVDSNNGNGTDFINVTVIGNGPTVSSVSPNSSTVGNTVPITINGSFLGSPTVTINGSGVTITGTPSVNLTNPTSPITGLSLVIDPTAGNGARNITVTTPSGSTTLTNAFNVIQPTPTLASIVPASGAPGQTVPIVLNGSNFNGVSSVTINGPGTSFSGSPVVNPARTQITGLSVVIASNATPGLRSIQVNTVGGFASNTFTVTSPTPTNDLCANPVVLSLGATINATNVGAATEGAVSSNCASGSNSDVFFSFTPSCTASYRFETSPSTFDTVLSVHAACPAAAANIIACNDDIVSGSLASRVDVSLTAGTTYVIRVASFGSRPQGNFTLALTATSPILNDECTGAANLPIGPTPFDTCAAVSELTPFTSCVGTGKDLWYTYTADRTARTTIETCGSSFDTVLEVFDSACGTATTAIACDDDFCVRQSRVSFAAQAGTVYRIRVSGFGSGNPAFGTGTLTRFCPADFDLSGTVTVQDIFEFLNAWFAGDARADFDGGGITVQDIFGFLNAWFAGC